MTRLLGLPLILLSLVALAHPQSTPPTESPRATFATRTQLVLVPVVVTDSQGKHISKLALNDFRVEEDGRLQSISQFEEIMATANPMRHAVPPMPNSFTNEVLGDQSSRVLVIIALDFLNTSFGDEVYARRSLLRYLSESVRPNTLVSLVTIDGTGLHAIHDFTSNPTILIEALKRVSAGTLRLDTNAQDTISQGMASQDRLTMATEMAGLGNLVNPDFIRAAAQPMIANGRIAASREAQSIATTLEALQHLAQAYAAVPGRKALIWATGSFPFLMHDPSEMAGGVSPELYERTFQMLGNADIAMYPIDVRGLSPGGPSRYDANRPQQLSSNIIDRAQTLRATEIPNEESMRESSLATLRSFADMTGGQAFYNANDLSNMMARATADSSSYYLLSYYLTKETAKKSGWHKLKVSVKHEEARARTRSGFFVSTATVDPEASRKIDEGVALDSPIDCTAMPLLLTWKDIQSGGKKNKASFTLQVAAEVIRIQDNKINLDFVVVAKNAKGEEAGRFSQNLQSQLNAEGVRQIQTGGITYTNALQLPPGEYNVKAVVRDNLTGLMGSVQARLEVQ
jgi:VWFA-related protein